MRRSPYTDDYGGYAHDRPAGRRRVRRTSATHQSFRCDLCGAVRFVTSLELHRAARPRCLKCGGMLIETAAEAERHEGARRPVEILDRRYRCRACGIALARFSAWALFAHLASSPECRLYFVEHRHVMACGVLFGTLRIDRVRLAKWSLSGLSPEGEETVVALFRRQRDAMAEKDRLEAEHVDRPKGAMPCA